MKAISSISRKISIALFTILLTFIFVLNHSLFSQTNISGNISGILTYNKSPYYVTPGNITVAYSDSLLIEPGVEIIFNTGGLGLTVHGVLIAIGTPDSLIAFKGVLNNPGIWKNIYFSDQSGKSCKLEYCIIRDAGYDNQPSLRLSQYGNNIIKNCIIENNKSTGVYISGSGSDDNNSIIQCNIINNGLNGISCSGYYCSGEINSNIIINNDKFGIDNENSTNMFIRHNLVWSNKDNNYSINLSNRLGHISTININGDSCDANFNISLNPLFIDLINGDYNLANGSPCINAGDLLLPKDPDGSFADIGALRFDESTNISIENIKPDMFSLFQNYPNPFNPVTTIEYQLPKDSYVTLRIFNITGELVKTLKDERQSAGYHKIQWNGKDENSNSVAGGLYLYHLKADGFSQSNKMVLIK